MNIDKEQLRKKIAHESHILAECLDATDQNEISSTCSLIVKAKVDRENTNIVRVYTGVKTTKPTAPDLVETMKPKWEEIAAFARDEAQGQERFI
jgi:hypothetical protein